MLRLRSEGASALGGAGQPVTPHYVTSHNLDELKHVEINVEILDSRGRLNIRSPG